MRNLRNKLLLLSALVVPSFASAAINFNAPFPIQTGVQDASNLAFSSAFTGFDFDVSFSAGDPPQFINQINWSPGANWDALIDFEIDPAPGDNDYTLGTVFTAANAGYWDELIRHFGTFDSNIAPGIYDFDVSILGGDSATADDILFQSNFQVEIVPFIDASLTMSLDTSSIFQGATATATATLVNNSSRDLITNTWAYSNPALGSQLLTGTFEGNWFGKTIAEGGSRTDLHSTWTASDTQTIGNYIGFGFVVGGFHPGDELNFGSRDNIAIEVTPVPEPATLAVIGLGLLAMRKRRKA